MTRLLPLKTWLVLGVVVFCVVMTLAWCHARREAATARGQAQVASGSATAGKGAVEAIEGATEANQQSQELGRENASSIAGADNAKTSAGDAGERAYLGWCKRERMRGNTLNDRCNRLLGIHP